MKPRIKETIVVEGRDDIIAVKNAVDCEIIATHGFGFGYKLKKLLKEIEKRNGIIIFTDADYMGKNIRKQLQEVLPNAKHAYLSREQSNKNGNIGVENAKSEDIVEALLKARATVCTIEKQFSIKDLINAGLVNGNNSSMKREKVCNILKIGHANAKQMVNKLNSFGISREEFDEAIRQVQDNR